jgi:N-methylhydantoinase A
VVADLRHDFVRTLNRPLDEADMGVVHRVLAEEEAEGRALIAADAVAPRSVAASFSADMQFVGQTHLLRVPLPHGRPAREDLQARFEGAYLERFRVELPEIRANLVNLNCSVVGTRPAIDLALLIDAAGRRASLADARTGSRPVWFDDGWLDTPVYRRDHLPATAAVEGPAVVEQLDTTIILGPGDRAAQDADGNLVVEVRPC